MKRLPLILLAAIAAALGFGIGQLLRPASAAAVADRAATSASANPANFAAMDFTDKAGFDARVAELEKQGLSEPLAQWLVLSEKVRSDLAGSLAIARQAHLTREWAAAVALIDPEGGFDLVRSARQGDILGSFLGQTGTLGSFFQTLGRVNPNLGLKLLRTCPPSMEMGNVAATFFGSWAKLDPGAAMDAATQLKPAGLRDKALEGLFAEWGLRDRHGMMKWASDHGAATARLAFSSQFRLDDRMDPVELIDIAREFPEAVDQMVLINVAGNLSTRGAKGWGAIADFPKGPDRDGMIQWFAERLSEVDPEGTLKLARTLTDADRQQFLRWTVRRKLATLAPEEMAKFALTANDTQNGDASEVIYAWGKTDPRAAVEWSRQNLSGVLLADSLSSAFQGWGRKDPAAAIAALDGLSPAMRARLLPGMMGGWAAADPHAALAYVQKLPAIDQQRAAGEVIRDWAFNDPAAAAAALASQPTAGMDWTYESVAFRFGERNPQDAMSWATSISDTKMSAKAVGEIVENWAKKDAAAASERVAVLKPGEVRDRAAAGLVESLGSLDPESAADWANSIGAAGMRRENLRKALESWRTKDKAAAAAFAGKLKPDDLKNEMMGFVNGQ